jgi:capsid assembly protease
MKRELLIAEVGRTTWAIEPNYGERVLGVLSRWARGERASDADLQDARAARDGRAARAPRAASGKGIAVLPLYGTIAPRANLVMDYSGGTSCQVFSSLLREALSDDSVAQIIVDIDSPGGSVAGVQELASEIMQARTQKPVIGIANHLAASAAYWLGSCCSELYASPSAEVGSIGVYTAHEDVSKALEDQGVNVTLISAGRYKTEMSPYGPLDPEAKAFIQSSVDAYYRAFTTAVARGRGVSVDKVRTGMGQGRCLQADQALAEKMVDGVIDFNSLVRDMQTRPRSVKGLRSTGSSAAAFGYDKAAAQRASAARQRELQLLSL